MATNPQEVALNQVDKIEPSANPEDSRLQDFKFGPGLDLPKGQLIAEITATQTAVAYNPAGADGSQLPVAVLRHPTKTDADGSVFFGATAVASIDNPARHSAPAFIAGTFYETDLVGLDAAAETALGARKYGNQVRIA